MHRLLTIILLSLTVAPAVAQTPVPNYTLYQTVWKPYLAFPAGCRFQINWTKPIARGNVAPDIEREGKVDGRALIEDADRKVMSLMEWTKPVHDKSVNRLVMYLAAQDMRANTTFRVNAQIQSIRRPGEKFSGYGPAYVVFTRYMKTIAGGGVVTGLGGLISTAVNQGFYEFHVRVQISSGGNCFEEPVVYKFRKSENAASGGVPSDGAAIPAQSQSRSAGIVAGGSSGEMRPQTNLNTQGGEDGRRHPNLAIALAISNQTHQGVLAWSAIAGRANDNAIAECNSKYKSCYLARTIMPGSRECFVLTRSVNRPQLFWVATRNDIAVARIQALNHCSKAAGGGCKVVTWHCNF